jgi:hypothetical protein
VVVDYLEPAIELSRGRFSVEALREFHAKGRVQVWACLERGRVCGAVVTEIALYPTGRKVLRIFLLGGEGLHLVPGGMKILESYGREWGCAAIEAEGRRGWGRLLHGYRETWRAFEKELFDG